MDINRKAKLTVSKVFLAFFNRFTKNKDGRRCKIGIVSVKPEIRPLEVLEKSNLTMSSCVMERDNERCGTLMRVLHTNFPRRNKTAILT